MKPLSQDWLIAARAYPSFGSMKRLGVFLLPLDGMLGRLDGMLGRRAWPCGRALDLESGGPGFKSSSLPLDGFVFGGPEFNSSTLCK